MVELFRHNPQNHKERKEERAGGKKEESEEGGREKQQFSVLTYGFGPHTYLCKVTGHECHHIPMEH